MPDLHKEKTGFVKKTVETPAEEKKGLPAGNKVAGAGLPAGNKVAAAPAGNVAAGSTQDMTGKSIEELAKEVIRGNWGNGDERKKRLTEAGYDYDAIQKKVNELLK